MTVENNITRLLDLHFQLKLVTRTNREIVKRECECYEDDKSVTQDD